MNTLSDATFVLMIDTMSFVGDGATSAYAQWLASRPDLWCVGDEVQREIHATLADVMQRSA